MRSAAMAGLAVVLVLALVIPVTPEPGTAASVSSAEDDDDDDDVPIKRNNDSGKNATDENDGPRWRKPLRPGDQDNVRRRLNRKPAPIRRRLGALPESPSPASPTEKVTSRSDLIKLITQVAGNLSLSEWLQFHNLTLRDVLHGDRGVLTALTATPAPPTTPLPTTTTTSTEAPRLTARTSDIIEPTTIPPRSRLRYPPFPRTTSKPRKLPTTTIPPTRKITSEPTPEAPVPRTTTEVSSPEPHPAVMESMAGTALDPMMSPDQTDGHTSKPRRIVPDSSEEATRIDVESLDITTPRLTGQQRLEIKAAAERFINAQVYSPGQIPDKYSSTRAPPASASIEPDTQDTKVRPPTSEVPAVQINRKFLGSHRAGNDSLNELEVRRRLLPPRRLLPTRLRNMTGRASAKSSQLPPTRITFPLPEMIPVKAMIADAIERGDLPATSSSIPPSSSTATTSSTTTPAPTVAPVAPGDEILDLLNSEESSKRLARILESRNMTLEELLQLRERGSSQLHFSDFRPAETVKQGETPASVKPVQLVPKSLDSVEVSRGTADILQSFHEVPKYPFDSEEAASAASAPAVVEAPRRSPRLLPDSAVVIPVPQEAEVVAEEADASDLAEDGRFHFVGARAAVAVAAGVCGLAVAVFLSLFAACRWRQRRSMRRARSAILCEQLQRGSFRGRSLSPVLVTMSKSPVPYYSNKKDLSSRATSNTASNRHYYLWRSLRKAFQEDEMQ